MPRTRKIAKFNEIVKFILPQTASEAAWFRAFLGRISWILPAIFLVISCGGREGPRARDGVLDLRAWDFKKNGVVTLNGEWEIWSGKLYSGAPEEVDRKKPDGLFKVPGLFRGTRLKNGRRLPGLGTATLRLKLLLPDPRSLKNSPLEIHLHRAQTAWKFSVEGRAIAQGGIPEEKSRFRVTYPARGALPARTEVDLYFQISNFHHYFGGPDQAVMLGVAGDIDAHMRHHRHIEFFVVGFIALIGLYGILFFLLNRRESETLWFGLFCTAAGLFILLQGGYLQEGSPGTYAGRYLMPLEQIVFALMTALFVRTSYRIYRGALLRKNVRRFSFLTGIFIAGFIALPAPYASLLFYLFYIPALGAIFWIGSMFIPAFLKKKQNPSLYPALLGLFIFAGAFLHDVLLRLTILSGGFVLHIGLLSLVFSQGLVLALHNFQEGGLTRQLSHELKANFYYLSQQEKLKNEILAAEANELRGPLEGIIGIAQSLLDGSHGELPPDVRSNLEFIVFGGQRLSHLVRELTETSSVQHSDVSLRAKPVGPREIIDSVSGLTALFPEKIKTQIHNEFPADLPPVRGDENRLRQVFHNLLTAILKNSQEGDIVISGRRLDPHRIEISLLGPPPAGPEKKPVFHYLDPNSAEHGGEEEARYEIYSARQLIELHEGVILEESVPGEPMKFRFSLPVYNEDDSKKAADAPLLPAVRKESEVKYKMGEGPSYNILVVDDDTFNLQVLNNHLSSMGNCNVIWATNGAEAMDEIFERRKIDLALVDIVMPGLSGFDVCRNIRRIYPASELPVILLTNKSLYQEMDVSEGFLAGANDYLAKPIARDELLTRIRFHLNLKESREELIQLKDSLELEVVKRTRLLNEALDNLKEKDQELQKELDVASRIQRGILPNVPYESQSVRIEAFYESMGKVGGDFFDIVPLKDGSLGIIIADVSGHGIPAALITTMTKISYTDAVRRMKTPLEIMTYVNTASLEAITTSEYLSALCLRIEPDLKTRYLSAGHQPAILMRKRTGLLETWEAVGPLLGIFEDADESFTEHQAILEEGDRLFLYTDGIIEAINGDEENYGIERLEQSLLQSFTLSLPNAREFIIRDWRKFMGSKERYDDSTFVLLEVIQAGRSPTAEERPEEAAEEPAAESKTPSLTRESSESPPEPEKRVIKKTTKKTGAAKTTRTSLKKTAKKSPKKTAKRTDKKAAKKETGKPSPKEPGQSGDSRKKSPPKT